MTDYEAVMDGLTKHAERHPQGGPRKTCWNHHDTQNVPCQSALELAWLFKLTDHPMRRCGTCDGYGWRYKNQKSLDHMPCPNCLGSGLEYVTASARQVVMASVPTRESVGADDGE